MTADPRIVEALQAIFEWDTALARHGSPPTFAAYVAERLGSKVIWADDVAELMGCVTREQYGEAKAIIAELGKEAG